MDKGPAGTAVTTAQEHKMEGIDHLVQRIYNSSKVEKGADQLNNKQKRHDG